jgi:REP-associated tyrosine transposase
MPRRPRVHLDDVPLHIVQRGHNREPCFFAEDDYLSYLHWLGEALAEARCALHAYVLMTNHVHLLLTPKKAEAVPKLIISLGRRYVQYVNRTYRRTGTLWDSRYKSSSVQAETYLLTAQRYIELNPVRAAMVDDPAHYRWTSYRANALGHADARLTSHSLYLALGATDKDRQAVYRALFRSHLDRAAIDDIRLALSQNQPLGNERFLGTIEKVTGIRREARPRGRPRLAATDGGGGCLARRDFRWNNRAWPLSWYVNPAGTIRTQQGQVWGHIVDGAYFDNSGTATAGELMLRMRAVADAVEQERLTQKRPRKIALMLILIRNDLEAPSLCDPAVREPRQPKAYTGLNDLLSSIRVLNNTSVARSRLAEESAINLVRDFHRGTDSVQSPHCKDGCVFEFNLGPDHIESALGWSFTRRARELMDARLSSQQSQFDCIKGLLTGTGCERAPACSAH